MMQTRDVTRAVWIVLACAVAALVVNAASPRRIAWVGSWPSTFGTDTASAPPSYEPGDAPILRLDEAAAYFQSPGTQFVDARDPEDYKLGHIPGAVNLPFDYYGEHAAAVLPLLGKDRDVITYCGGADCELSLYLARQLRNEGYTKVHIFFGGFTQWQEAGLPLKGEAP